MIVHDDVIASVFFVSNCDVIYESKLAFFFSRDENVCKHNMKISKVFYIAGALLLLANISPTSGFPRNNRERSSARKDARILEDSLLTEGTGNKSEWLLQK